jgi:hypothetical protein
MSAVGRTTRALVTAPLPQIIEKLGVAIAEGQYALDRNSVEMARIMAETPVRVGDESHTLLSLGFTPSFFAYTEATVEARLSFTMSETTDTAVGGSVTAGGGVGVFMAAATVSASYARRFSVEASGTSSIAARLVSLPPPEQFMALLRALHTPDRS